MKQCILFELAALTRYVTCSKLWRDGEICSGIIFSDERTPITFTVKR